MDYDLFGGLLQGSDLDPDAIRTQAMAGLLRGRPIPQPQPQQPPPQAQPPQQMQPQPQPGQMLPRALAAQPRPQPMPQPQMPQQPAPPDWQARAADIDRRRQAAEQEEQAALQPIDRTAAEAAYRQRTAEAPGHMVRALAAIEAGKEFAPISQHYLKASEEAEAPLKTTGGTFTSTGFIEDPGYGRDLRIRQAQAKLQQIDRAEQFNLTTEQREHLQRERIDAQKQIAVIVHAGRPAASEPLVQVQDEQGNVTYQPRSQAIGKSPPPKGTSQPSEDERKSSSLLQRLEFSQGQLKKAIADDPSAASPNVAVEGLQKVPLVGEAAANVVMSPARQRVEAAQLDLLDAALTLGTGAAYTKEQLKGYAKSYFPQAGDDLRTIVDKQERLNNVIASARTRAGRALPTQPAAGGANADPLGLRSK